MADLELSDFDVIEWTPADEARPAVDLREVPSALSDRAKRVLAGNGKLRGIYDETSNGYPSDSERAFALAYCAGACGLSVEDAARLIADLYSRPGKKTLHLTKLEKTLRAWVKGREHAELEATAAPVAPTETPGADPPTTSDAAAASATEARASSAGPTAEPTDATIGVDAFLATPPDLTYDIEGVRIQGDHGWTGGAPKSMKGLLSLEEARATSTGTPFLGHFTARKCRVLYISEEDRVARLHRRVHAMLKDRPSSEIPGPQDLRFLVKAGVRLDTVVGLELLRRHIALWRPDLVFLEHFDKLHSVNSNESRDVKPLLEELDALHTEFGCTFRIQKHNRKEAAGQSKRKGEMLAGSVSLFGWGESSVYLTLLRRGVAQAETDGKDGDMAPRFLVLYQGGRLVYGGEVQAGQQEGKREAVLDFLRENPGATRDEVAEALKVSDRTAGSRLSALEKGNLVVGKSESSRQKKQWWLKDAEIQGDLLGK